MEGETILLNKAIEDNQLREAYSRTLGINTNQIVIVKNEVELNWQETQNLEDLLILKIYEFKFGDFIFEVFPLISARTRGNDSNSDLILYRNLAKELQCAVLVPGSYNDIASGYDIIIQDGKKDREVLVNHPEEYGDQGVTILSER